MSILLVGGGRTRLISAKLVRFSTVFGDLVRSISFPAVSMMASDIGLTTDSLDRKKKRLFDAEVYDFETKILPAFKLLYN